MTIKLNNAKLMKQKYVPNTRKSSEIYLFSKRIMNNKKCEYFCESFTVTSKNASPISRRARTASVGITLVLPDSSAKALELLPASTMSRGGQMILTVSLHLLLMRRRLRQTDIYHVNH